MPSIVSRLFRFNGGVKPPYNKEASLHEPIAAAAVPEQLIVPLHQSIGGIPRPCVKAGDRVLKGQMIGQADGWISSAAHAPTSGTIREIGLHTAAHPSGLATTCVVIDSDGKDEWMERQPLDYANISPETVREHLQAAGVVGLGGAVFPSHAKLTASKKRPMEELVINGAECEPFITCDDVIMRERAEEIVRGSGILRDLLQPKKVLIGIEDNKPEAIAAMQEAVQRLGESSFQVVTVPTRYPAGGAKQLIRVLTGKEVPAAKRSPDFGVQCFNVATAYSVWRVVAHGEPLISRIVTLAGAVEESRNWDALIGTPVQSLLQLANPSQETDRVIMGGPMMGFALPGRDVPVIKATNCLIAATPKLFPPPPPEMPCIRCGACAEACPHELLPFELYWYARAKNFGKTQDYDIFDCIECGCCSYVCPSHIPLVQYFRFAKSEIWARESEKNAADAARLRFQFREEREAREKAEKAERLAKAAAAQAAKEATAEQAAPSSETAGTLASSTQADAQIGTPSDAEAAKKAAIAAALARAREQRAAVKPQNIEHLSGHQEKEIAEIEARRIRLHEIAHTELPSADATVNANEDTATNPPGPQ